MANRKKTIKEEIIASKKRLQAIQEKNEVVREVYRKKFSLLEDKVEKAIQLHWSKEFPDMKLDKQPAAEAYRKEALTRRAKIEKINNQIRSEQRKKQKIFNKGLKEIFDLGFAEDYQKYHHNPDIRFRIAEPEIETNLSPPPGIGPTRSSTDASLVEQREGLISQNILSAAVTAFGGEDTRTSFIRAYARPTLIFRHEPPIARQFCHHINILFCYQGLIRAESSTATYWSMSRAMEGGGQCRFSYSATLSQVIRHSSGSMRVIEYDIIPEETLAQAQVWGGIFMLGPWGINLMGDPVNRPISFAPAKEYPFPVTIFGSEEGGGPLEVRVQFNLEASARNREAWASVEFDQEGQYINVSEVLLVCD